MLINTDSFVSAWLGENFDSSFSRGSDFRSPFLSSAGKRRRFHWWFGLSVLMTCLTAGCGRGNGPISDDVRSNEMLNDVGEVYRQYSFGKNAPPKSFADIKPFEAVQPVGYQAIKDGSVIILYGKAMINTQEGPPSGDEGSVIAYEKKAPETGGYVLMANRSIKKMTAEELKSAVPSAK